MLEFWHVIAFIVLVIIAVFAIAAPRLIVAMVGGAEPTVDIIATDCGVAAADEIRRIREADLVLVDDDPHRDTDELVEEARCGGCRVIDAARGLGREVRSIADDESAYMSELVATHGADAVGQFLYFRALDRAYTCGDTSGDDASDDVETVSDREAGRPELHRGLAAEFAKYGLRYSREFGAAALEWARRKFTPNYVLELGRPNYARNGAPLKGSAPSQRVAYTLYGLRLATMIGRVREALDAGRSVACVVTGYYAVDLRRRFRVKKG